MATRKHREMPTPRTKGVGRRHSAKNQGLETTTHLGRDHIGKRNCKGARYRERTQDLKSTKKLTQEE